MSNLRSTAVLLSFLLLPAASPAPLLAQAAAEGADDEWGEPGCYLARGTPAEAAARESPLDSASISFGDDVARVCYGAPSARERTVMGDLVPYGTLWRTGANEATALHLEFPAEIAGTHVPAGSYSLYTLPGEERWGVILSADVERWGVPIDEGVQAAEIVDSQLPAERTEEHVERLTFHFERIDEGRADLVMEWERTRIRIPIERVGS